MRNSLITIFFVFPFLTLTSARADVFGSIGDNDVVDDAANFDFVVLSNKAALPANVTVTGWLVNNRTDSGGGGTDTVTPLILQKTGEGPDTYTVVSVGNESTDDALTEGQAHTWGNGGMAITGDNFFIAFHMATPAVGFASTGDTSQFLIKGQGAPAVSETAVFDQLEGDLNGTYTDLTFGNRNYDFAVVIETGQGGDTTPPEITCPADVFTENDPGECGAIVSFQVDATDDSGNVSVTCDPTSGSFFNVGTTIVTCVAMDPSGNTSQCEFEITVNDTENPTITCPEKVTVTATTEQGANAIFDDPVFSDNCPNPTVSCDPPSGSLFPLGSSTVECIVVDAAGNMAACSFTVEVVEDSGDTTPPVITCPDDVVTANDPGQCGAVVNFQTTATDDSGNVSVTCDPASGSFFAIGTTTVTCLAVDPSGNSAQCTFDIIVNDAENPTITCPENVTATAASEEGTIVSYSPPVVADNCPNVTFECDPPSGSLFPLGVSTVNCTALDAAGNTATCSFTVEVVADEEDTTPPEIDCPADIITANAPGDCGAVVGFEVTASDNSGNVTVTCDPPSSSFFDVGTTTVTCVAMDSAGNTAQCQFDITVRDAEAPEIECPPNQQVRTDSVEGTVVSYPSVDVNDNCSEVTVECVPESGTVFPLGSTTVECTATDAAGNTVSCSFVVEVIEGTAPPEIEDLIEIVESLSLTKGIKRSLLAKIEGTSELLEKGKLKRVANTLGAFINEVEAQAGKKRITPEDAELLIATAEAIIEELERLIDDARDNDDEEQDGESDDGERDDDDHDRKRDDDDEERDDDEEERDEDDEERDEDDEERDDDDEERDEEEEEDRDDDDRRDILFRDVSDRFPVIDFIDRWNERDNDDSQDEKSEEDFSITPDEIDQDNASKDRNDAVEDQEDSLAENKSEQHELQIQKTTSETNSNTSEQTQTEEKLLSTETIDESNKEGQEIIIESPAMKDGEPEETAPATPQQISDEPHQEFTNESTNPQETSESDPPEDGNTLISDHSEEPEPMEEESRDPTIPTTATTETDDFTEITNNESEKDGSTSVDTPVSEVNDKEDTPEDSSSEEPDKGASLTTDKLPSTASNDQPKISPSPTKEVPADETPSKTLPSDDASPDEVELDEVSAKDDNGESLTTDKLPSTTPSDQPKISPSPTKEVPAEETPSKTLPSDDASPDEVELDEVSAKDDKSESLTTDELPSTAPNDQPKISPSPIKEVPAEEIPGETMPTGEDVSPDEVEDDEVLSKDDKGESLTTDRQPSSNTERPNTQDPQQELEPKDPTNTTAETPAPLEPAAPNPGFNRKPEPPMIATGMKANKQQINLTFSTLQDRVYQLQLLDSQNVWRAIGKPFPGDGKLNVLEIEISRDVHCQLLRLMVSK